MVVQQRTFARVHRPKPLRGLRPYYYRERSTRTRRRVTRRGSRREESSLGSRKTAVSLGSGDAYNQSGPRTRANRAGRLCQTVRPINLAQSTAVELRENERRGDGTDGTRKRGVRKREKPS